MRRLLHRLPQRGQDSRVILPEIEYDARLVEEAVLRGIAGAGEERIFRKRRDAVYGVTDPEQRERDFRSLHLEWFARLGLDRPITLALCELSFLRAGRIVVAAARAQRQEGAELYVRPDAGMEETTARSVLLLLRPERFLQPDELLGFLRSELLHVADMLDPAFGYEPRLPAADDGPSHDRLLHDRYRMLWQATIDGRLERRGLSARGTRERLLGEFLRLFPMLGAQAHDAFSRFYHDWPHHHAELVAFARHPEGLTGRRDRCPLCGFPGSDFHTDHLPPELVAAILREFPLWRPPDGICRQCAELYRSREVISSRGRGAPAGPMHPRPAGPIGTNSPR